MPVACGSQPSPFLLVKSLVNVSNPPVLTRAVSTDLGRFVVSDLLESLKIDHLCGAGVLSVSHSEIFYQPPAP